MKDPLAFENVTVRYQSGGSPVLTDISLKVAQGERVALLGLNGSGKTTLLLASAGLLPFTGTIIVNGVTLSKKTAPAVRETLGFVFSPPEDQILFPRVLDDTVFSLLRKGCGRREAEQKARETLGRLGVGNLAALSPFALSHGQRQRVALAGALVSSPALFLLDEPSASLDPVGERLLVQTLLSIEAAMLIATHDIDFAAKICGRFVVLAGGKINAEGADFKAVHALLMPAG